MPDQDFQQGAITFLHTLTEALPTNAPQPLATSNAVPVPTSPASPLQVQAVQPLAVVDPNSVQSNAPAPVPQPKRSMTPLLVGGLAILGLVWWMRRKH